MEGLLSTGGLSRLVFIFYFKLVRLVGGSSVINGDTPSSFLFIYEDRKFSNYQRKRSARDLRIRYNAFLAVVVFVPDMSSFYRFRILTLITSPSPAPAPAPTPAPSQPSYDSSPPWSITSILLLNAGCPAGTSYPAT